MRYRSCVRGRYPRWGRLLLALGSSLRSVRHSVPSNPGYHPWFVHQYSLVPTTKREHYASLFSPKPKDQETFDAVLPLLPDPQPFSARLEAMRTAIVSAKAERLVMVGEIGLDATARVHCETLTPFKTSMAHQIAIATLQLELAASLGVPVSFHCVAASGPTLDLLRRFPNVSVDVHSLGGMSASFLTQVARYCPKAYFSPSLLVTARNREATKAIAAVPRDRILVESDTHDCARCDRLVWGAVLWISAVRGWKVESGGEWELDDEEDVFDDAGRLVQVKEDEVWAVRTLERNWARFIGIAF